MRGNIRSRPLANTTEDGINGTQRNFRAYVPQSRPADASRETQQNNKLYRPEPRKLATGSSVGSERRRPGINGREVTINDSPVWDWRRPLIPSRFYSQAVNPESLNPEPFPGTAFCRSVAQGEGSSLNPEPLI